MKTKFPFLAVLVITALATLFAQGPLTPPGPPGTGTMKSLDQIEARTPISSAPFTISASGSYYLTASLSVTSGNGITINASQVTLDLNGFSITSSEASPAGTGILLGSGVQNIRIHSGIIKGSVTYNGASYTGAGFLHGIANTGTAPLNVRVADLTVAGCGLQGIDLGTDYASTAADRCNVRTVGGDGIRAGSVNDCTTYFCGGNGILSSTVANSIGRSTGTARGIYTISAINCFADSVGGIGLDAYSASDCHGGSTGSGTAGLSASYGAHNCNGFSTSGDGVTVFFGTAQNCYGSSSSGYGLFARTAQNCYGISTSNDGIRAEVALNCKGACTGGVSSGILADIAQNCYGTSSTGFGMSAGRAFSCLGLSYSGDSQKQFNPLTHRYFCGSGPLVYP